MFSVSPEVWNVISLASRWLFAFFALVLLFFAFSWHHSERRERRERFKNLPGAGTIGELVVVSGSDDLSSDTWFPVPREGVLGALRSCDLVVPCPGVRSQHLDFSWQDGTGLLIRPRLGCEVLVDGVPVSRRGAYADAPMVHGSLLQVGSAVLRLQLFSALSHTNRIFTPQVPAAAPDQQASVPFMPPQPPVRFPQGPMQSWPVQPPYQPRPVQSVQQVPVGQPVRDPYMPGQPRPAEQPVQRVQPPVQDPYMPPQSQPAQPRQEPSSPRGKGVDRWKEDWSD